MRTLDLHSAGTFEPMNNYPLRVKSEPAWRVLSTAEVPQKADGIAAARRTRSLCQIRKSRPAKLRLLGAGSAPSRLRASGFGRLI